MSGRPFSELTGTIDRRRAMTSLALTAAAFATFRSSLAQPPLQAMEKKAGSDANREKTSLLLTGEFNVSPQRIYSLLLDSKQFTALTGLPALIAPTQAVHSRYFRIRSLAATLNSSRITGSYKPGAPPIGIPASIPSSASISSRPAQGHP